MARFAHVAYLVKNISKEGDKKRRGIWTKIGAAWEHADKKGFDIILDALPVDGQLTLRVPMEKGGDEPA